MKVKYISDDGHEFESKTYCEHYENALNRIDHVQGLVSKTINGTEWFRISNVAEFYYWDHMDDTDNQQSPNTMYDITQIYAQMGHRFPFWITKNLNGQGEVMVDKKRLEMIDGIIESLEEEIDNLKKEKDNLADLRGMDMNEAEFKEQHAHPEPEPEPEQNENEGDDIELKPFMNINGKKYQLQDLMRQTMEESEFDEDEWAELSNTDRDNLIKEKIKELKNK